MTDSTSRAARGWPPNRWVRPYVLTRGRTEGPRLHNHTLVAADGPRDRAFVAQLLPEQRILFDQVHAGTTSVAELAAHSGLPIAVTRVLLADFHAAGQLRIGPENSAHDPRILKRVLDGLRDL